MARGSPLRRRPRASKEARAAGLGRGAVTLHDVDKRRAELWTTSIVVVLVVSAAIFLYTVGSEYLPDTLRFDFELSRLMITILVGGLALTFLVYVIQKERSLRKLTDLLVEERVRSAALSNRLTEISRLSELGKAVDTTLDPQDVFDLIISSAIELLGGTEGSIMLLDEAKKNLVVESYHGPRYEAVMGGSTPVGQPVAGVVAERKVPMLIQGGDLEGVGGARGGESKIFSSVCVPLIRRDEILGVLNLNENEGKRAFTDQDLNALGFFAEHAAVAIGNARLYAKERETVEQLEELDQLKSDFVATISHELKTPLTAIIGAAKTVGRKGPSMAPEQHASFMDMIDRQGTRLLRLIEDVLVAARIESGARTIRRELVDLRVLAEDSIEAVVHSHPERARDMVLRAEPERPKCWGDMTAIMQILTNLVDNALKYSNEGSRVIVFVKQTSDEVVLEVADHGMGIDEERLQAIFERFRQLDSSSTRKQGGVGLGLFIVKNLVSAHGGTIDVDSEPQAGTTFTIRLPQRHGERSGDGQTAPAATKSSE